MHKTLVHKNSQLVKFSEADPLGIVWHGHFIRYFEDSREDFGAQYGISYLDLYRRNLVVPIVNIQCDYKRILRYGHRICTEVTYHDTQAAKLLFTYRITDEATNEEVAIGKSTQVFLQKDTMELLLTPPQFLLDWKNKWLL